MKKEERKKKERNYKHKEIMKNNERREQIWNEKKTKCLNEKEGGGHTFTLFTFRY